MFPRLQYILAIALFSLAASAFPQAYPINGGDVGTCSGALLDSGGQGGGGYGNNEHFTITICPGQPDSAISLSFVIFNLSAAGTLPTDHLTIYDGNNTSAPVIGTWSGTSSPGIISASFANTSGCLTVEFTSNETGTGVFAASISCTHPCEPPIASGVMGEPSPALICQGEPVHFNGSASTAASGFSISQYLWDFGDGSLDSTSGGTVNHTFPNPPGQHVVHLHVKDNNGCSSINSVDLVVQVSTTPAFTGFAPITRCAGEPVDLTAVTHVSGTTWTSIPDANYGGGLQLPDDIGVPFSSAITFSAFPPGSTISNVNDLVSVCVSMEHAFMGDFVLKLTAPNGAVVVLHQQGGGGTFLGIPVDDDSQPNVPGTCWEYCFSPAATNGTWAANANGGTLPAGTYQAVGSFNALVGSPLNGTWTLTFTDLWALDNGFLCSWGLNFDPSLLPPDVAYTPTPGIMHSDSSYWSGPALANDPAHPLHYIATPTTVGPHLYTYTVTDNFGCSYDTTLTITITPGVHVNPTLACGSPLLLQPGLQLPLPTGTILYQWSPATGLSSTTSPYPTAAPLVPTWYTLHAFPAGHPLCSTVDSVLVNPPSSSANSAVVTDHLCAGGIGGSIQITSTGTGGPWNYIWKKNGTVVRSTPNAFGDTYVAPAGSYTILIQDGPNGNGCMDSISAVIHEPPPLLLAYSSADTTICLTGTTLLDAASTGGTGTPVMHWDHGAGNGTGISVSPAQTTTFHVYATDANNCVSDTATVTVNVRAPLQFMLPDTVTSCPKVDVALAPTGVGGGDGQYTYDWLSGGTGPGPSPDPSITVNKASTTTYCLTVRDGCETPAATRCVTVDITPVPPLVLTVDSVLGCKPFTVHFQLEDTTGLARADWSFFDQPALVDRPMTMTHTYAMHGLYNLHVNVHWPNGCSYDSTYAGLVQVIDVPHADFRWTPSPADIFHPEIQFQEQAGPVAVSYAWRFGELGTSTLADPVFTFPNDTGRYYPVQLVARNFLGCADSVLRIVTVGDVFLVHVPTAFTPDADGRNDVLYVVGNDISDADFKWMIFDRWGEKVFETTDPRTGWDGRYGGKPVKNGVYVWMLRAQSRFTKVNRDFRGHVTVVR